MPDLFRLFSMPNYFFSSQYHFPPPIAENRPLSIHTISSIFEGSRPAYQGKEKEFGGSPRQLHPPNRHFPRPGEKKNAAKATQRIAHFHFYQIDMELVRRSRFQEHYRS